MSGWLVTFYGSEGFQHRIYVADHFLDEDFSPEDAVNIARATSGTPAVRAPGIQFDARRVHEEVE